MSVENSFSMFDSKFRSVRSVSSLNPWGKAVSPFALIFNFFNVFWSPAKKDGGIVGILFALKSSSSKFGKSYFSGRDFKLFFASFRTLRFFSVMLASKAAIEFAERSRYVKLAKSVKSGNCEIRFVFNTSF